MYDVFFERAINLDKYLKNHFHYDMNFPDTLKVKPETDYCDVCAHNLKLTRKPQKGFILMSVVATCDVYTGECCNVECKEFEKAISYCGTSSGIVNYSNKFFIGVELITEYMRLYSKNGLSFSTWIENKVVLSKSAKESGFYRKVSNLTSYFGALHEVFCRATDLIIFPKETFYCCSSPKVLQMDGLVNSVKANRITTFSEPWIKNTITKRASKHSERQIKDVGSCMFKIIDDIIKTKQCSVKILESMQKSTNKGIKVLSFCFVKTDEQYELPEAAVLFAKTLIKSIAAVNSLISSTCEPIISRYFLLNLCVFSSFNLTYHFCF